MDNAEWQLFAQRVQGSNSVLAAVKTGGVGDLSPTGIVWRFTKSLPLIASPLLYREVIYLIKDGGILTALESATGKLLRQGRLKGAIDRYFASPVAGDGKIFFTSESGKISVVTAGGNWEVLAVNDLDESCFATPALSQGRIYVRTAGRLYAFGKQ